MAADFFWLATAHSAGWEYIVGNSLWGLGFALAFSAGTSSYLLAARDGEATMFSSANMVVNYGVGGLGASLFATVLTSKFIPRTPIPSPTYTPGCGSSPAPLAWRSSSWGSHRPIRLSWAAPLLRAVGSGSAALVSEAD